MTSADQALGENVERGNNTHLMAGGRAPSQCGVLHLFARHSDAAYGRILWAARNGGHEIPALPGDQTLGAARGDCLRTREPCTVYATLKQRRPPRA
jgi:hypothetical protein